jgi:hypothetical protein
MACVDPISVLHQLERRRDVEFISLNPLLIRLNCCSLTCTAVGYTTKQMKSASYAAILTEIVKDHKIIGDHASKLVCPNTTGPCEFCSEPEQSTLSRHITWRLPRLTNIWGMSSVCQICHYWTDGTSHYAIGTLCCDLQFSLMSDSKTGLAAAFETFIRSSDHYINVGGIEGMHTQLHPNITSCPLCKRQL